VVGTGAYPGTDVCRAYPLPLVCTVRHVAPRSTAYCIFTEYTHQLGGHPRCNWKGVEVGADRICRCAAASPDLKAQPAPSDPTDVERHYHHRNCSNDSSIRGTSIWPVTPSLAQCRTAAQVARYRGCSLRKTAATAVSSTAAGAFAAQDGVAASEAVS
jgi:hypothetical protein